MTATKQRVAPEYDPHSHITPAMHHDEEVKVEVAARIFNRMASLSPKLAYEYKMTHPWRALFMWKGTLWPLVTKRYELYVYPSIHGTLVVYAKYWRDDNDYDVGDGEDWWGAREDMVPWAVLTLLTPLMIFFLVFFLGQCYNRFNIFFGYSATLPCRRRRCSASYTSRTRRRCGTLCGTTSVQLKIANCVHRPGSEQRA